MLAKQVLGAPFSDDATREADALKDVAHLLCPAHRDWARPFHTCTGTGLARSASCALRFGRSRADRRSEWRVPFPVTSASASAHVVTCAGTSPKATRTEMPRMLRQKAALRRNSAPRAALRRWPSSLRHLLAARSGCLHVDGTPACRLHRRRTHGSHSGSLVPPQLRQIPTQHPCAWAGSGLRAAKRAAPGGRAPGLSNARLCDHSAGSVVARRPRRPIAVAMGGLCLLVQSSDSWRGRSRSRLRRLFIWNVGPDPGPPWSGVDRTLRVYESQGPSRPMDGRGSCRQLPLAC